MNVKDWPCMTTAEYTEWLGTNATLYPSARASSPCVDCSKAYAAEMRAEGRCVGVPGPSKRPPVDPSWLVKLRMAWEASAKVRGAQRREKEAEAQRLRAEGLSYKDIAGAMGISESSAWSYVKRPAA